MSFIQNGEYPGYERIVAGHTKVVGPWKQAKSSVRAHRIRILTSKEKVCGFQGEPGDWLMQDIKKPQEMWFVKPHLGEWRQDKGIWVKEKSTQWVLDLPPGVEVESFERNDLSQEGGLLTLTNIDIGDYYFWSPEYVRNYVTYV